MVDEGKGAGILGHFWDELSDKWGQVVLAPRKGLILDIGQSTEEFMYTLNYGKHLIMFALYWFEQGTFNIFNNFSNFIL